MTILLGVVVLVAALVVIYLLADRVGRDVPRWGQE